jgi:hypothetical protein
MSVCQAKRAAGQGGLRSLQHYEGHHKNIKKTLRAVKSSGIIDDIGWIRSPREKPATHRSGLFAFLGS